MQQRNAKKRSKTAASRANRAVVRWLVLCFPIGLMMMWSDGCTWRRLVKSGVSLGLAVALVLLFTMRAPEQKQGGVQFAYSEGAANFVGPTLGPDMKLYEAYVPKYIPKATTIVQPTPTPEPYYVYCNDGGKYYHIKKCRYVKPNTPRAPLIQALDAGFSRCKKCNAPTLTQIYGDTLDY